MRNLFLALVLANLAFAAWTSWYAPADAPTRPIRGADGGITLLEEAALPEEEAPEVRAAPPGGGDAGEADARVALGGDLDSAPPGAASACVSLGPFDAVETAESSIAALQRLGYAAAMRVTSSESWLGRWVYVDAIPTQAEARTIAETFRQAGIAEAYVIAGADSGNLVSLGIFSESQRAEQRRDEAIELGFEPVLVDRTQTLQEYWLELGAGDAAELDISTRIAAGEFGDAELASCSSR